MRDQKLYIYDILKAIDLINSFVSEMDLEEFKDDLKTQSAVIRQFEVIGEAVKKLDKSLTMKHPEIDWSAVAGMRDLLIHQYFGVDLDLVWESIKEDLPAFKKTMKTIQKEVDE